MARERSAAIVKSQVSAKVALHMKEEDLCRKTFVQEYAYTVFDSQCLGKQTFKQIHDSDPLFMNSSRRVSIANVGV